MATVLFIGRFQPFHNGHLGTIEWLEKQGYHVVVCVGSSDKSRTIGNPWTFEERKQMIQLCFKGEVIPLQDIPDDETWVEYVEKNVHVPFDVICTGNDRVEQLFREKGYFVIKQPIVMANSDRISGTDIRERMRQEKEWKPFVPFQIIPFLEHHQFEKE